MAADVVNLQLKPLDALADVAALDLDTLPAPGALSRPVEPVSVPGHELMPLLVFMVGVFAVLGATFRVAAGGASGVREADPRFEWQQVVFGNPTAGPGS